MLSGVSARAFPAPENALLERSFDIVAREIEGPPKKGPPAKGPPAKKPKCKRSSGLEKRNDSMLSPREKPLDVNLSLTF